MVGNPRARVLAGNRQRHSGYARNDSRVPGIHRVDRLAAGRCSLSYRVDTEIAATRARTRAVLVLRGALTPGERTALRAVSHSAHLADPRDPGDRRHLAGRTGFDPT